MLKKVDFTRFLWYNFYMETIKKANEQLHKISVEQARKIVELEAEIIELNQKIEWFMEQFRLAQHRRFGASSEKSAFDGQLHIFNEAEAFADESDEEPPVVQVAAHPRRGKNLVNDRLPEELPVETVVYDLPEEERGCPECGKEMCAIGKELRRELKIIPAKAVIVERVRIIYGCGDCERNADHTPIMKAPMPEPVIKGSFATPEAIAHIMCQKFVMGAPLYRQEQDWKRQGIQLSRQTMSVWLIRAAEDWLEPVYDELHRRLLARDVAHADETTLQVLREPGKTARSKSYMWLYRTGGDAESPIVLYEYQPDRRKERPAAFLKEFTGYLQVDGYEAYHTLPENITVVGCWAHARRKFDEALKGVPKKTWKGSNAALGKQYCDMLFAIERNLAELDAEDRFSQRREHSKPVLDAFLTWLKTVRAAPESGLGKAVHYALAQWKYLERYLLDGRLEISNNRAERGVRPFVIGRKNFLFCNAPKGAKSSAIVYSLIETAKENDLNPFKYLAYIFHAAPNGATVKDLLPENAPADVRVPKPPAKPGAPKTYAWEEDK